MHLCFRGVASPIIIDGLAERTRGPNRRSDLNRAIKKIKHACIKRTCPSSQLVRENASSLPMLVTCPPLTFKGNLKWKSANLIYPGYWNIEPEAKSTIAYAIPYY
jgi:hypothetical protein